MKKTLLKQLVDASYNEQGLLEQNKVFAIADHLRRKDLKSYIKALKVHEAKTTVLIETSSQKKNLIDVVAHKMFPDKKIRYIYSPDLLLGTKVTDNDMVYEANLAHSFDSLLTSIKEYD